jgi:hypothetical protein
MVYVKGKFNNKNNKNNGPPAVPATPVYNLPADALDANVHEKIDLFVARRGNHDMIHDIVNVDAFAKWTKVLYDQVKDLRPNIRETMISAVNMVCSLVFDSSTPFLMKFSSPERSNELAWPFGQYSYLCHRSRWHRRPP